MPVNAPVALSRITFCLSTFKRAELAQPDRAAAGGLALRVSDRTQEQEVCRLPGAEDSWAGSDHFRRQGGAGAGTTDVCQLQALKCRINLWVL